LTPHCEQALAELRRRWSGDIFNAPPRSQPAIAEEKRLISVRHFHYEPLGTDPRAFELLPAGRIGQGAAGLERHWAVIERDGAFVLQFYSFTRLTVELTKREDGSWDGRGIRPASFQARLSEMTAHRTWPYAGVRSTKSAAGLVDVLLDTSLFAAGFDAGRAGELRAALSLLNDRFDDVPEQIESKLPAATMPEQWRSLVREMSTALAAKRDERLALTARADYSNSSLDLNNYERIP
jgi:hypothetical protein